MNPSTGAPFPDPAGTWNRRFDGADNLFGTEPNTWLVQHASVWQSGQRVLCVADGEGRNSVWMARQGLRVDAFDIAQAGALAQAAGVAIAYAVCDCEAFASKEILELREYEAELAEGRGHRGRSALIGLVARWRTDADASTARDAA